MKNIDITKQILLMHESDVFNDMVNEVEKELAEGVPKSLQDELDKFIAKANLSADKPTDNIIPFNRKKKENIYEFAETVLLAASGTSLAEWFSQPINFGGAGFILDVRRVIGSDNEVDLYLTPNTDNSAQMRSSLSSYLGKSLDISILNDGEYLLTATIYVDEEGTAAEGSGYLSNSENMKGIKGKISINILMNDN
ncbi:hypothetical protein CMT41_07360 [Colwellia sp. MT41]|uniref:Uncharacterized protein n=1 Tax=Colwellia marinimaniae TaxID=1513592 RepID=A0ABQ0MZT0_9GAMM|nr:MULTISPECIES: hypothetical protein [Colwellia]ALO34553.1 hypothetical protein CMT41_07360 [Colwellia sp. MT41]GAW97858.1 hypothetical protein MTCD1_03506 [Colwellia marinimaniae]